MLLATAELTKRFGSFLAIDALSLAVPEGGIRAIIGPNGAGKSTLLNLVCGQLKPTSGRILIDGRETTGRPPWEVARRGVGRSFQITSVLAGLSCHENVRVAVQARRRFHHPLGRAGGEGERHRADAILDLVGLGDRAGEQAGHLSHGEQRHLEIGIAIAAAPRLVLLDEPTAGMSLTERSRVTELIRRIGRDTTVLLVEHDVGLVRALAETVSVLHEGRVLREGLTADVLADPAVHEVYLRGVATPGTR